MKYFLIVIFRFVLNVVYFMFKLFLKPKNKITFLSRQSNEKSLDFKLLQKEIAKLSPETKQVFRLKKVDSGIVNALKYAFFILGDMYHLATSEIAVCDTYSIAVSFLNQRKSLKVFQIWHSLGATKKFGLQSLGLSEGRSEAVSRAMRMHKNYTTVFAPSKATAEFYKEAFGVEDCQIEICGLPHIDIVLNGENCREEFIKKNPKVKGKKIIFYLPTFRSNEEKIVDSLNEQFENSEFALITSLHPLSTVDAADYGYNGEFSVFDIMKFADAVITDYSACVYEAALLCKPVYLYVPDFDDYNKNRGINVDIKKELPDCVFENVKELFVSLKSENFDLGSIKKFAEKYVESKENCAEKMAKIILRK